MIVERWTWKAKPGRKSELIEWAKALVEREGLTARVYSTWFGSYNTVSMDAEFETDQDRLEYWAGIDWSQPEVIASLEKLHELMESENMHELLHVH